MRAVFTTAEQANQASTPPIIFYDGVCGVCDRFVQWVINHDPAGTFRFAPIQGETAHRLLGKPSDNPSAWTIWLSDESGMYDASTAVLKVAKRLNVGFGLPSIALMVPCAVRDWAYRVVAKNRYRIFGKIDSCQIPSPVVRARILP